MEQLVPGIEPNAAYTYPSVLTDSIVSLGV